MDKYKYFRILRDERCKKAPSKGDHSRPIAIPPPAANSIFSEKTPFDTEFAKTVQLECKVNLCSGNRRVPAQKIP
jgi:hypothetical protein